MRPSGALAMVWALAACSFEVRGADRAADAGEPMDTFADAAAVALVDTGLVVRYFMDEAGSGQGPSELIDSAPDPLNIPITYGQAVYVDDGNRGLRWANALGDGKVEESMATAKFSSRLRDETSLTLEVVADVDGADAATDCHIAGLRGLNPDFMLSARGSTDLRFHRPYGVLGASWVGINNHERMVLHVVYDSTQVDPERRIDLYKNGVLMPKTTSNPPVLGSSLALGAGNEFMIGNDQNQAVSISGTIYYVAYYEQPLTTEQISNNVQRLLANDDP